MTHEQRMEEACARGGFRYVGFDYVVNAVLAAAEIQDNRVVLDPDSDFLWWGLTTEGNINLRFRDAQLWNLSNGIIQLANLPGVLVNGRPYPIWPPVLFPAGAEIGIVVQETGGGATRQLLFRGAKRYML